MKATWQRLDDITRSLVTGGMLGRYIEELAVTGVAKSSNVRKAG